MAWLLKKKFLRKKIDSPLLKNTLPVIDSKPPDVVDGTRGFLLLINSIDGDLFMLGLLGFR